MVSSSASQWTLLLVLTALLLSIVVALSIASFLAAAYFAAPKEVAAFLDTVDSSVAENETYDRDVSRLARLDDRVRLGRLLREIQRGGDDLREALSRITVPEGDQTLRTSARLLWPARKRDLEERLRRLDMLRMRFLVMYMSVVAHGAAESSDRIQMTKAPARDPEKMMSPHFGGDEFAPRPQLPRALSESIKSRPPLRRLATPAAGHKNDTVEVDHRKGWAGVVRELQLSPLLHKRQVSIEKAMSDTP